MTLQASMRDILEAKMTIKAKRAEILAYLQKEGWKMSLPSLKIPHATSPDGEIRLWFKPQAIWYTQVSDRRMNHEFKLARSIGDINPTEDPAATVKHIVDFLNRPQKRRWESNSQASNPCYASEW